jgi:UDP:flavonoid glycosyltransferase YjiC (YdhE family)
MVMRDALTVDLGASLHAYQTFHASLPEKIELLSMELLEQKVDLVLADIPYLTLAAAQKAGIPSVALCSLNWADILEHALLLATSNPPENTAAQQPLSPELARVGAEIVGEIRDIYQQADYFLLPTPSMPMPMLTNTLAIGPVCTPGVKRREALTLNTQVAEDGWFVLVGMGGMPLDIKLDAWPTHMLGKPLHYIVADSIAQNSSHPQVIAEAHTGLSYSDLVASADLILTKPGYGMFVEAAAAGVPVLYVERRDWPEAQALTDWFQTVAHCTEISTEALHRGAFAEEMRKLLERGRYDRVAAMGNMQGATFLAQYLCAMGRISSTFTA